MPTFVCRSPMPVSPETLFAWHERPGAFERLAPPWERLEVVERSGGIRDGGRLVMRIRKGPLAFRWIAEHSGYQAGRCFTDRQVKGPFASWRHEHRVRAADDGTSVLEDVVDYRLPGGMVGRVLGGGATRRMLRRMFRFRHDRTRRDLERHAAVAAGGPLRIAVTGASGLVGRQLVPFLGGGGHEVLRLVRREPVSANEIAWDPARGEIDVAALEGVDAVVHLAAEGVARRCWSRRQRDRIRSSRVDGTRLLARTIAGLSRPPRVLVSASSVAIYGDRRDAEVDETGEPGRGFYPGVCREWEAATAEAAGIRVAHLRIGRVLTPEGGTLRWLLRPFRLEVGGWVGAGRTPVSWIGRDDLVGAIHHVIFADDVEGPVNAVSPEVVSQVGLVRAVGRVFRRPTLLPTLPLLVLLLGGERDRFLRLTGARVRPARLHESGYRFGTPGIESAIRRETGRLRTDGVVTFEEVET